MPISTSVIEAIAHAIAANNRKLEDCAGPHEFAESDVDFEGKPYKGRPLRMYFKCSKCDGVVDRREAQWYAKGLEHGRGR